MKKIIFILSLYCGMVAAAEVPLCALPLAKAVANNVKLETDPGCSQVYTSAQAVAKASKASLVLLNSSPIPAQLSVGAVYLQPINMAPAGMMLARDKADIHLELDIHAKANLKSRGFAPGDWLPNAHVTYTLQKIGSAAPLLCGTDQKNKALTSCPLMAMVASDGAHYGDNVKLAGPGFYLVTFDAHTDPMKFGWHTDTDSKVLGTEYVDWKFKQNYIFKFTGIGKKGGY